MPKGEESNKRGLVSADGTSSNVTDRYDLSTVLARVRLGATVSAFHTPGHYTQKPGIVTQVFGELAQVPGHDF